MESTITSQIATNSSEAIEGYQLLGLGYWFATPDPASLNHWPLAIFALLSTAVLIVVFLIIAVKLINSQLNPPQQKFLTKTALFLAVFGPLGWVFVTSRLLGIVFISARFWWFLWFLGLMVTIFWLYR